MAVLAFLLICAKLIATVATAWAGYASLAALDALFVLQGKRGALALAVHVVAYFAIALLIWG